VHVTEVRQVEAGFEVTLETGERFSARRVIVAAGLASFTRIPEVLSALPCGMVTHASRTSEYLKTQYAGKDVTVIGAGQSALEAAALLHEGGAQVRILARRDVWWSDRFQKQSLRDKLLNPITVVGPGRMNWVLQHLPILPYHLPRERRVRFTRGYLGPLGAWWLRDRVEGKIPVFKQTSIVAASATNGKIHLRVQAGGEEREMETDHIISATGYEPDVDRLSFIGRELAGRIRRIERAPELSTHFESSVPGLYFVGPVAAFSFGPLVRFVAGAPFTVPRVVRHIARHP
jgi:cation diffusion facilitator CzcD-associated flavoprotein CzcO